MSLSSVSAGAASSRIYHADFVLTMDANNRVIDDGAIVVDEAGAIVAVDTFSAIKAQYPQLPETYFAQQLLMPGLINTHAHSGLLRGTAEGLPVWEWLQQFIDPMHRVVSAEEAEIASRLCYGEALLSGTTTIVDMWRHMDGSARAAETLGLRAMLVPYVAEHPDHNYFETLDSNEAIITQWHGKAGGRIEAWVGLEHMFYAVSEALTRINDLCAKYQVGFHTHSNESRFDVEETLRRFGKRPVEMLQAYGLLDTPKALLAHCVWLDAAEINILAKHRVGVAHNPISNMKLASGAAPVIELLAQGVAVGLGTDGEKENNNLDMFEEMKTASLLAKFSRLDAAALDAWSVCRMATIDGARALGIDHKVGSLEVGKEADVIAVRTNTPRMTPLLSGVGGNLHHNLVHAVQGQDVTMTMVKGKVIVEGGILLSDDQQTTIKLANHAVIDLFRRRGEWLAKNATVDSLKANRRGV